MVDAMVDITLVLIQCLIQWLIQLVMQWLILH